MNSSCDLLEKSYFCSIANNSGNRSLQLHTVVICLKNRTFAVSQTTPEFNYLAKNGLWFAWKIVLLQYRKQLACEAFIFANGCDLLEKSYFCSIANNSRTSVQRSTSVVICLKNRTFAVSQTTLSHRRPSPTGLWFAWKIVLLQYRKQPAPHNPCERCRCDLLEKSYFCSIANNWRALRWRYGMVVICLKNRTFAVSQTTIKDPTP